MRFIEKSQNAQARYLINPGERGEIELEGLTEPWFLGHERDIK
jgi:hypothetical protein